MTFSNGLLYVSLVGSAALIVALVMAKLSLRKRRAFLVEADELFHRNREWLEARFLTAASKSGRPRGLRWVNCDFDDDVVFARDRQNGTLRAFTGATISFEAIPGGGMEEVEAVGNLRAATAVFLYEDNEWKTDGRTIFNLNPKETIRHFGSELESVS